MRFAGHEVTERVGGIVAPNAILIGIRFQDGFGVIGVVLSVPISQDADAHVYTKEDFERHQRTEWSGTEEAQAERLARCQDTLELLFRAAARADGDPPRQRLPGLMDSFMQWCESAREDFKLGPALDEELAQRRFRAGMTQEYRDWRAMARGNPEGLKAAGFEDDPSRGDREHLRLELELVPGWAPGRSMKPPQPAVMKLAESREIRASPPEL